MPISEDDPRDRNWQALAQRTLRNHWKAFLVQGLLMMVLGAVAVIAPNVSSIAVEIFIGWLLFTVGVARIAALGANTDAPGYWPSLLLGILAAVLGALLALWPVQGLVTLTMALVAYLLAHGLATVILAFEIRTQVSTWLMILAGGLVDFILAAIVVSGWPGTVGWVLGLLVGINLLLTGLGLVFAALGARTGRDA